MKNIDLQEELVSRYKKGDIKAQYKLFSMNIKSMYNTALRFFPNQMDAEDIVQESFIAAFKKINSFNGESTFSYWLKQIVINKCISELRKRKFYFVNIDEQCHEIKEDEINENFDPVKLHEIIKDLPIGARTIINLYAFENLSHKEIADKLKISESTSKTQYMRAKMLLSEKIKNSIRI